MSYKHIIPHYDNAVFAPIIEQTDTQVKVVCPFCGAFHTHGCSGEDPHLSDRVSHCTLKSGSYWIIDPIRMNKLVKSNRFQHSLKTYKFKSS